MTTKWIMFWGVAMMMAASTTDGFAQQRGSGSRSKPSFDRLLSAFDANKDGALSQGEVPSQVWSRLSKADSNADGTVTRAEYDAYKP